MEINRPTPLLGGLSPAQFMRRHWQKKPLLIRQAFPDMAGPPIERSKLFDLAGGEGVESRLIRRSDDGWTLRRGPLPRRALPPRSRPGWTLLVQGVDLHDQAVHDLLGPFRFLP
ncbi:MAG: cupin domain-containing protein, partial [Comamonadaceae bacterium]